VLHAFVRGTVGLNERKCHRHEELHLNNSSISVEAEFQAMLVGRLCIHPGRNLRR
jgi:hypothetical protein